MMKGKADWSMKDKTSVAFVLEKELRKALRIEAAKNERSLAEEIRFRLKQSFNDKKKKEVQ